MIDEQQEELRDEVQQITKPKGVWQQASGGEQRWVLIIGAGALIGAYILKWFDPKIAWIICGVLVVMFLVSNKKKETRELTYIEVQAKLFGQLRWLQKHPFGSKGLPDGILHLTGKADQRKYDGVNLAWWLGFNIIEHAEERFFYALCEPFAGTITKFQETNDEADPDFDCPQPVKTIFDKQITDEKKIREYVVPPRK